MWYDGRNTKGSSSFSNRNARSFAKTVEQMSERQELLATLMESKKSLQKDASVEFQRQILQELKELEKHKSKEAMELLGQKHRLDKLEKERERASTLEGKELPVVESAFTVATRSSFRSFSPSLAPGVDEEMRTTGRLKR